MHQFNEHHPELKGFSAYFAQEIFPFLEARDADRKASLKKAMIYCSLVGVLALIVIVVLALKMGHTNFLIFIAFGSVMIIGALYSYLIKDVRSFTKAKIVGGICSFVGWRFRAHPTGENLALWSALKLIPAGYEVASRMHNRRFYFEDEIFGEAHGATFKSVETKLVRKGDKSSVTEFHGQLMSITFPRAFSGRTIVLRDKGFLQGKKKGDMKRVGLVDPVFEKIFEAYGTDQVEARYLLTPVFMQTLVDLENSVQGKNIRFGFSGNQLFIAVETKNQFEAGSMFEPLTNPARTQKILDEIGAVYDVVDVVSRSKRG